VHILRTPKGGRRGLEKHYAGTQGGGGVKAWVRSIFITAFLLYFGGFNGVCDRNATRLICTFSSLCILATMKPTSVCLSSPLSYPRVEVVTTAALPSRTFLSVFSSTDYFVQFLVFCSVLFFLKKIIFSLIIKRYYTSLSI